MPLPDERPRQSVANLIGRFETQNKRLSISASSPSRSSSVVSHTTDDSVKEETKEKREWPPKSVTSVEKPSIVIPTSFRHVPPSLSSQPISTSSTSLNGQVNKGDPTSSSQAEPEIPLTARALQRQNTEAPSSYLENWRKDIPLVSSEMASETHPTSQELTLEALTPSLITPTAASMQKSGNPISPHTPIATSKAKSSLPASKATPATSKAPIKGVVRSPPPKQSLSSSTTQPLRPQHTGQSVASTTSTRKPTPKAAPTTPSQSKTGPRSDAKTPTSARPKTPSTGLFAPTAASLARSRNAPLPVPTPTKKPTLSSSSMDRLSKPTAASLSKARTPTVAAPTSTSRPTVAKTKAAPATTTKSKEKSAAQTVVAHDQNGSGTIHAATEDNVVEAEEPPAPTVVAHDQNDSGEVHAAPEDNVVEAEDSLDPNTAKGAVLVDEGALSKDGEPTLVSSSLSVPEPIAQDTPEDTTSDVSVSKPVANDLEEHKPTDELEDIVNLLESATLSKSEPAIIPDIPDDILEIPDEEEKRQ